MKANHTARSSRAPAWARVARRRAWMLSLALLGVMAVPASASSQPSPPDQVVAGFDIYMHYGSPQARDDLWAVLPERIERVRTLLGPDLLSRGEIHVVRDINALFEARGEAVRAPRWAQAVALPARRMIVLRMPDPSPVQTLTHELSHLAVWEAAGGNHVPKWFLEGFAQLQAEQWGVERAVTIGQAAMFDNTLSFDALDTQFPPHSLSAGLAYTQSFHFVRRLIERHGEAPIQVWLNEVRSGTPWREAFRAAFGVEVTAEFEAWRESVRVWYGWIPALVSVTTLWAMLAALALWARRVVRRRRRARLEDLAERERGLYPPDPDDDLFS